MTTNEIATLWSKISRKLNRRGIIAFWVREPTKNNKVHYHLLVVNNISKEELQKIIEESFPLRSSIGGWHKKILPITNAWNLIGYILKAKIPGWIKGRWVKDRYAAKRILFQQNAGLRKHGTIGKFWILPMEKLWQHIRDREKAIADALSDDRIRRLASELYRQLFFSFPRMTEKKFLRRIALTVNQSEIQQWAAQLDQTGELFSWSSGDNITSETPLSYGEGESQVFVGQNGLTNVCDKVNNPIISTNTEKNRFHTPPNGASPSCFLKTSNSNDK